jgi:4-hydroxy-tetrahydrodipicolinate synthase
VLYYKHLMVLEGNEEYRYQLNPADCLSAEQQAWLESQWRRFRSWWDRWPGA